MFIQIVWHEIWYWVKYWDLTKVHNENNDEHFI